LNFYPQSKRCVLPAVAEEVVASLPPTVEAIGLFVNFPAGEIRRIAGKCQIRTLQLHGDEPPELLAELRDFQLIRAFRVGTDGLGPVDRYLDRLDQQGVSLFGCLIDAHVEGTYGGTGKTAPWELLEREWRQRARPRLILAGGLTAANVAEAVRVCRPWGVDVAGGVEAAAGVKDPRLVRAFCENARTAS
jgi:phosphoribosylanthranilate isomerase